MMEKQKYDVDKPYSSSNILDLFASFQHCEEANVLSNETYLLMIKAKKENLKKKTEISI